MPSFFALRPTSPSINSELVRLRYYGVVDFTLRRVSIVVFLQNTRVAITKLNNAGFDLEPR